MSKDDYGCTVGQLLDFIEKHNIPRDGKVFIERIEDVYFEKHNWKTIEKKGSFKHEVHNYFVSFCPVSYDLKDLYIKAHY